MPFVVTNFGINGKPKCDFQLVNNGNFHPISHHFQEMADWSNFHCRVGACL